MKQLDVQWGTPKMPDDVKEFFFDYFRCRNMCNDVWVEYWVAPDEEINILDQWLIDNIKAKIGEKVLLKHWW